MFKYVYNNILPNLIECKIQMNEIYHFYIEKIVDIIQNSSDILYANNYDELIKEMNNVDITNEIKNPDKIKNMIGELSKNKSLFNESLLTNPEILKQASDPNMIKEALKILKENPDSLRNMLNGNF